MSTGTVIDLYYFTCTRLNLMVCCAAAWKVERWDREMVACWEAESAVMKVAMLDLRPELWQLCGKI